MGLALHFKYAGVEPNKDVVAKLSLKGWVADDILEEEKATGVSWVPDQL